MYKIFKPYDDEGIVDDGLISAWELKDLLEVAEQEIKQEVSKVLTTEDLRYCYGKLDAVRELLKIVHAGDQTWIEKYRDA